MTFVTTIVLIFTLLLIKEDGVDEFEFIMIIVVIILMIVTGFVLPYNMEYKREKIKVSDYQYNIDSNQLSIIYNGTNVYTGRSFKVYKFLKENIETGKNKEIYLNYKINYFGKRKIINFEW